MKTVAVIGGTGFLGRHVVPALLQAGWEARALSRRNGCDATRIDPGALRGCDAVVNLAGIKREQGGQTFRSVHVDLVARLAEAMKAAGVRRLVHISVVVARSDEDLAYHDTKWQGEEVVRASGLDWTILRPGVIYGAGDDLLSHLALMIHAAPLFPVVNAGMAPMMPVHAGDVAAGVVGALRNPASAGKTYDLVGPDRLVLRDVVARTAEALGRPVWILPTPAVLMAPAVAVMEKVMARPLSTRAQLAMLVEGLPGDASAARSELGFDPAPFEPARLRPLLEADGHLLRKEIPWPAAAGLYLLAVGLLSLAMRGPLAPWKGMTVAMGILLAGSLALRAVRARLRPTLPRLLLGLGAGALLYGSTRAGVWILSQVWPDWEGYGRELGAWKVGYSLSFLLPTLVMIVIAEEAFWRGVLTRFSAERLGHVGGILAGAALYAAAHAASGNPLLLGAALACGAFWGLLYSLTDDLTAPIVSHLFWDVMIMFVTPLV